MLVMVGAVAQVLDRGTPSLGMADIPETFLDQVLNAPEECPGECIFIDC